MGAGFEASLEVHVGEDLRRRVTEVRISVTGRDDEITPDALRLPLRSILATVEDEFIEPGEEEPRGTFSRATPRGPGGLPMIIMPDTEPKRSYRASTDEHLKRIAALYRQAVRAGRPPIQTIKDTLDAAGEFTSKATVKRWVSKAREQEFLGPTSPRVAGEKKGKGKR